MERAAPGGGALVIAGGAELTGVDLADNTSGDGGQSTSGDGGAGGRGGALDVFGGGLGDRLDLIDVNATGNASGAGGAGDTGGAGGAGGAIAAANLTADISATTIVDNSAATGGDGTSVDGTGGAGGGLQLNVDGTVTETTVGDNVAAGRGGGIDVLGDDALAVQRSTIAGNDAGTQGGGVHVVGDLGLTVTNSTIVGNSASGDGGGLWSDGLPTIDVAASTIASNQAPVTANVRTDAGGIGSLDVVRSAIGDPLGTVTNCAGVGAPDAPDTTGTFEASTTGVATCGSTPSTTLVADLLLRPLANDGGPTATRQPQAGSPLIDALATCVEAADQRGVARPGRPAVRCRSGRSERHRAGRVLVRRADGGSDGESTHFRRGHARRVQSPDGDLGDRRGPTPSTAHRSRRRPARSRRATRFESVTLRPLPNRRR